MLKMKNFYFVTNTPMVIKCQKMILYRLFKHEFKIKMMYHHSILSRARAQDLFINIPCTFGNKRLQYIDAYGFI